MNFKKVITAILIGAITIISQTPVVQGLFDKNEKEVFQSELVNYTKSSDVNLLFGIKQRNLKVKEDDYVYLGGQTVGIAFYTDGLYITDTVAIENEEAKFINPATDAGLKKGDYIISANGIKLNDISNLDAIIKSTEGKKIQLEIRRKDKTISTEITPVKSKKDGQYRLGLWLKDGAAGLGTITYIDDENKRFGALGHAICDGDTGEMLVVKDGRIVECNITGVNKGDKGVAGELKGTFGTNAKELGTITTNGKFGLNGTVYSTSNMILVKLGSKNSIYEGDAYIYSDFENGEMKRYTIKILHINDQTYPSEKSMVIQVTDKGLIDKTGGIVQGLSGSPIVQDKRLIGAVTHVMINDPTKGYGIFIENMIN